MGSLLAALTTIIVAVLGLLLAAPYIVDWNAYKDVFEIQAGKIVGRPVRLEGDIDFAILPVPKIYLRGLRVADDFGNFERPFAEAEGFNMVLSLPALISGTVQAKSLELDQPIFRFVIDEFGDGNWQSIGPYEYDLPVVISNLVLDNVQIRDGALELRQGRHSSASRIDRIHGTFIADNLTGPFRFEGKSAIGGRDREVFISAGKIQESSLRIKASIRSEDGVSLYQADGEIAGLGGALRFNGPVAAKLALDEAAQNAKSDKLEEPLPGKAVELRAKSQITLRDVKLDDISLTFTRNDKPQSFTGSAYAAWHNIPELNLNIASSWVDIDQMLQSAVKEEGAAQSAPATAIAALPKIFEGWPFKPRQGQIQARIDQAGLGGDVIETVNFSASHNQSGWQIETLEARLPGETEITVKGSLPSGETLAFSGDVALKGNNLSRLLRWGAPSLGVVDTGNAQNFSLSGTTKLGVEGVAFSNAKGTLGSSSFSGNLVHNYGEDSQLILTLDSDRLDLRSLFSGEERNALNAPVPAPLQNGDSWAAATEPAAKTSLADALQTVFKARQSMIALQIAHLQVPDFEARDVKTAFRYENGTFDISALKLATTDGLNIKADGQVTGIDSKPDGAVNLTIEAPTTGAVASLAQLAGLNRFGTASRRRIDAIAPLTLSGNLDASRQQRRLNLTLSGNAAGSEISFTGRLDGDFTELSEARVDINGEIGNEDGRRLIAQLAPEVPLDNIEASAKGAGVLKFAALGAMNSGLISSITLSTPEANGRFEGQIAPLDAPWSLNGELSLQASQASTALSMLRLSPGGTAVTGPLDLKTIIAKSGSSYEINALALKIGGETINGGANIDVSGERPNAAINIEASSVTLPKLAAYLVDWDRSDQISPADQMGGASIWPNQAFSLRMLQDSDATVNITAPKLALSDSLALNSAEMQISQKDGTLSVKKLSGDMFGGNFTASGTLTSEKGRAALNAELALDNAELAEVTAPAEGEPLATGKADLSLTLSGEGLSPRGLLTVLNGKGELKLSDGTLNSLDPSVLAKAADKFLGEDIPDQDKLTAHLSEGLHNGSVQFAAMSAPIVIKDGVSHIEQAKFEGENYSAEAGLIVDLTSFRLDSEWRLAYRGETKAGGDIPPIRFVFAGPLEDFTSLKPTISTQRFERFLSTKRLDQDLERLEKLSKQPPPDRAETAPPADGTQAPVTNANPSDVPPDPVPTAQQPQPVGGPGNVETAAPVPQDAPSTTVNPDSASDTANAPSGVAEATPGRWSADVEGTDTVKTNSRHPQIIRPGDQGGSANFADKIRGVLNSPRVSDAPARTNSGSHAGEQNNGAAQYRTQSYSGSAADNTGGDDVQRRVPPPAQDPKPKPAQEEKKPSGLPGFFEIFGQ